MKTLGWLVALGCAAVIAAVMLDLEPRDARVEWRGMWI